jgi:hypothetical protein
MWDIFVRGVAWLLLIFFGGQAVTFVGLMLWMAWTDTIKPRLIPAGDIDRMADDIVANYADPEEEAFARHERAWYRSDGAQQTYWLRVRKAVRKRLERS